MVKNEYNAVFNIKNIEFYEKNFKKVTGNLLTTFIFQIHIFS